MSGMDRSVTIIQSEMGPDMDKRYTDKAFYYLMIDAAEARDDLELVGKNVFRPYVIRPIVDDYIMDDEVVLNILDKLGHRGPV